MVTSIERLEQSYAKAEAAFATSVRAVERASKKRLSALLALPPRERFDHLKDSSLVPADVLTLTHSLRAESKPKARKQVSSNTRSLLRLSTQTLVSPATVAILAMAAALGSLMWLRTPRGVMVTQPVEVTLQYPNGSLIKGIMNPGKIWWLIRSRENYAVIRIWMPMTGYQEFEVPASIVQTVD